MQILFQCFYYTDEYFSKIENGILSTEDKCDLKVECECRPVLINVLDVSMARPEENGEVTGIVIDDTTYLLNIKFSDYVNIVPHHKAAIIKQKWAN